MKFGWGLSLVLLALSQTACNLVEKKVSAGNDLSSDDQLESTSNQPLMSADSTLTLLQDGRVLIAGGTVGNPATLDWNFSGMSQIFDPATGKFSAPIPMNRERFSHQAVLLPDGRVLVAGGRCEDFHGALTSCYTPSSAEIFDPVTQSWSLTGPMIMNRVEFSMIELNGKVYAFGGVVMFNDFDVDALYGSYGKDGVTSSIEVFDPSTNQWQLSNARLPEAAGNISVVALDSQRALLVGGMTTGTVSSLTGIFSSNSSGESYQAVGNLPIPHWYDPAVVLSNGKVMVVTGDQTQIFDPSTRNWRILPQRLTIQRMAMGLLRFNGAITMMGGIDPADPSLTVGSTSQIAANSLDEILRFDEQNEAWVTTTSKLNIPRSWVKAVPINRGTQSFIFGNMDIFTVQLPSSVYEIH